MKLSTLLAALALAGSITGVQAQDVYKVTMTKAEAKAYLDEQNIDLLPDNLPTKIMTGDAKSVEAMIVAGLDLKAKGPLPQSPLELAAQTCGPGMRVDGKDTLRMIDLLVAGGVDPNHEGMAGLSSLMIAAQQQCPPVVIKRLLSAGAKIDARTPQGFTPLSMALIVANYDGAQTLIDAGARISPEVGKKFLTGTADDDKRLVELVGRATAGQ